MLRAHVRAVGAAVWTGLEQPATPAFDIAEWSAAGLDPGQRYEYEILGPSAGDAGVGQVLYSGTAMTRRAPGTSFTFDLLTDSHIEACDEVPRGTAVCPDGSLSSDEATLLGVSADIR